MRTVLLTPLVSLGLLITAIAQAAPAATHPTTGQWRVAGPPSQVRADLDLAIDALAVDLHVLMREVAKGLLRDATKVCTHYDIDVVGDAVAFSCDGHTPMLLATDGPGTEARNGLGVTVRAEAEVADQQVVIHWRSDAGTRTNTFRRVGDGLELQARVTSRRLPRPLRWTVRYRQQ